MALRTYLTGIADAIREKKGTSDPINAQDFASEIASISTGGGDEGGNPLQALVDGRGADAGRMLMAYYSGTSPDFLSDIDFSRTTSMHSMFSYSYLTTIPLFDTSATINMSYMFQYNSNLTTIPLLDTGNVTNMNNMFNNCTKLVTIPSLNTSKVTDMSYMFNGCANLVTIPQIDTSTVTNFSNTFNECTKLTTVAPLNTSSATNMSGMFAWCRKLTTIDITHIRSSYNFAVGCGSLTKLIIRTMDTLPSYTSSMFDSCYHFTGQYGTPQDGRIYVPDDKVDALKAATGWANFAEIIVPLSTLVED